MKVKFQPGQPEFPRSLLSAARQLAESGKLDRREEELVDAVAAGDRGQVALPGEFIDMLERHRGDLNRQQRRALGRAHGRMPAPVIDFDSAAERLRPGFADDVQRLVARAQDGPDASLTERRVLEDLLARHGHVLEPQLRNLVVGFLRTMPDESAAPVHSGQFGALAQVVALRYEQAAVEPAAELPALAPHSRAQIEQALEARGQRGHLLVAIGAATGDEMRRLDAGQMSLSEFFCIAARGHFGDGASRQISLAAARERLTAAGLEGDLDRLLSDLPPAERERLIAGELSPNQIFGLLAGSGDSES
ncbi:MAG: hypothetical protein JXR83_16505 [Deltaproteobacteria bacterium]|nr:hypothetical protein [Deltaproteobacteria bacterium]